VTTLHDAMVAASSPDSASDSELRQSVLRAHERDPSDPTATAAAAAAVWQHWSDFVRQVEARFNFDGFLDAIRELREPGNTAAHSKSVATAFNGRTFADSFSDESYAVAAARALLEIVNTMFPPVGGE
jgi:hypothetical protein